MANNRSTDKATEKSTSEKTMSRIEGRELIIERIFDAPRELVFKAFTESEHLAQWWGPRGWTTTNYTLDVRPGGVWHFCMRGPDGAESWSKAVYHEIISPERIVYTDTFSDKDGNSVEGMPEMLITLEFTELEGKTKLTDRTRFASEAELQSIVDMGVITGITETWDRLEEHLAQEQARS